MQERKLSGDLIDRAQRDFEHLFERDVLPGKGGVIQFDIAHPKYHFLDYLVACRDTYLHGSNNTTLAVLEPRKATGIVTGQAETAVYATRDVLEAIFFAIIDRSKVPFFATRVDPHCFFIARESVVHDPWTEGMVYILNRNTFEGSSGGFPVSYRTVAPVAKLLVDFSDFPLLDRVLPIDSTAQVRDKYQQFKQAYLSSIGLRPNLR